MSVKKERACKRCGCTEDRACTGGCAWVADVNVCTSCLTGLENAVYEDLVMRIAASVPNARKQLKLFGQMILLAPKIKKAKS